MAVGVCGNSALCGVSVVMCSSDVLNDEAIGLVVMLSIVGRLLVVLL